MRLCVFLEPQQGATYDDQVRVARQAEAVGFDGFFRSDHYLVMGDGTGLPGPTDSWVTLAGVARETSRIRLGTLVTAATFRQPGVLAISVAQVDAMSGGRVELGLGAGWYEAEHRAYGIPFPSVGERFDRLTEQLEIITGLWSTPVGSRFTYDGACYQVAESPALPKPVQQPQPPVIVGGWGPRRTPQLAARFATEFNAGFASPEQARAMFDRVAQACAELGRAEPEYSVAVPVCCGRTDAQVRQRAEAIGRSLESLAEAGGVVGSPAQVAEQLARYREIGASRAHLQVLDMSDLDHLELVGAEVMPALTS